MHLPQNNAVLFQFPQLVGENLFGGVGNGSLQLPIVSLPLSENEESKVSTSHQSRSPSLEPGTRQFSSYSPGTKKCPMAPSTCFKNADGNACSEMIARTVEDEKTCLSDWCRAGGSHCGQGTAADRKSPRRHKAGLVGPAVLVVELVRPILFRSSTQDVENWFVARSSGFSTHDSGFSDAVERSQISICRGFTVPRRLQLLHHRYITIARFSSSCIRTGIAHPAISTRPAASSAALGETP